MTRMRENTRREVKNEIREYLKMEIPDFEERAGLARKGIDHFRAPLDSVDPVLDGEILTKVEEFIHDLIDTEEYL